MQLTGQARFAENRWRGIFLASLFAFPISVLTNLISVLALTGGSVFKASILATATPFILSLIVKNLLCLLLIAFLFHPILKRHGLTGPAHYAAAAYASTWLLGFVIFAVAFATTNKLPDLSNNFLSMSTRLLIIESAEFIRFVLIGLLFWYFSTRANFVGLTSHLTTTKPQTVSLVLAFAVALSLLLATNLYTVVHTPGALFKIAGIFGRDSSSTNSVLLWLSGPVYLLVVLLIVAFPVNRLFMKINERGLLMYSSAGFGIIWTIAIAIYSVLVLLQRMFDFDFSVPNLFLPIGSPFWFSFAGILAGASFWFFCRKAASADDSMEHVTQ